MLTKISKLLEFIFSFLLLIGFIIILLLSIYLIGFIWNNVYKVNIYEVILFIILSIVAIVTTYISFKKIINQTKKLFNYEKFI